MRRYRQYHPNILVVGDLMIDHYLWGDSDRVSPEAPVPVIDIKRESEVLGGAGNVINNLKALGANVSVASVIGRDSDGKRLTAMLKSLFVNTDALIQEESRVTTRKSRVIASNQQVVRFDSETKKDISQESVEKIIKSIERNIFMIDIILLSDYGKGVLTTELCQRVIELAKKHNRAVLVDPKGRDYSKYSGATLITPNKKEASEATGIDIIDDDSLKDAGFKLKNSLNLNKAIITLSEEGMAIFDNEMIKIPTVAKEVYDVTGAGDTVLATLGFVLACGDDIVQASKVANAAAAVVVGKIGSATATWDEIIEYEDTLHESTTELRIRDRESLAQTVKRLKDEGKKIVFTNGCFDILHIGHIKYLEKAKSFGDVLIVGVNSDSSVKRLKGSSRPINCEYDRAYLLASLKSIDFVTIFDEDTPYGLIKLLKPNILVKGGDYRGKEVVGSDLVDELKLVDFVDGKSTTNIIKKAQNVNEK